MAHNVLDTLPFPRGSTAAAAQTLASPTGDGTRVAQISTGAVDGATSPLFDNGDGSGAAGKSSARFRPDLAGRIVAVRDTKNGTGRPVLLRCVQLYNGCGTTPGTTTAMTVGAVTSSVPSAYGPGTALQMGNSSVPALYGRHGVVVYAGGTGGTTNTAPSAGQPAKPLDDAYAASQSLLIGDWVYVVEEGPCKVPILSGQIVTIGKEAASHSDGTFRNAAANEAVVGTWLYVNGTSGSTNSTWGILDVKRGYHDDSTGD